MNATNRALSLLAGFSASAWLIVLPKPLLAQDHQSELPEMGTAAQASLSLEDETRSAAWSCVACANRAACWKTQRWASTCSPWGCASRASRRKATTTSISSWFAIRRSMRSHCPAVTSASTRGCCWKLRTKANWPACWRTRSRTSRSVTLRAASRRSRAEPGFDGRRAGGDPVRRRRRRAVPTRRWARSARRRGSLPRRRSLYARERVRSRPHRHWRAGECRIRPEGDAGLLRHDVPSHAARAGSRTRAFAHAPGHQFAHRRVERPRAAIPAGRRADTLAYALVKERVRVLSAPRGTDRATLRRARRTRRTFPRRRSTAAPIAGLWGRRRGGDSNAEKLRARIRA